MTVNILQRLRLL